MPTQDTIQAAAEKTDGGKATKKVKATITMTVDNDIRLSVLAAEKRKNRSELLNDILGVELDDIEGRLSAALAPIADPSADPSNPGQADSRAAAVQRKFKEGEKEKSTILLTVGNDLRLNVVASLRRVDRSVIVHEILERELQGVVVTLRGKHARQQESRQSGTAA